LNAASFPTWRNVISMCLRSGWYFEPRHKNPKKGSYSLLL
jgi:hypothetical protein